MRGLPGPHDEALAEGEAELLDRIVDLKADVAAYREVAVAGSRRCAS